MLVQQEPEGDGGGDGPSQQEQVQLRTEHMAAITFAVLQALPAGSHTWLA